MDLGRLFAVDRRTSWRGHAFVLLVIIAAGIGIDVLMRVTVHHAAEDGVINFIAFTVTFFALRGLRHSLGRVFDDPGDTQS